MPDSRPQITIGMSVRNGATTLKAAMNSLLAQTCDDWELILIDDGSSDGSGAIARNYRDARIRVFEDGRCCGLATRMNQAIGLGKGKYFARMDADDIAYPERLACQLAYLEEHPNVDLVGAGLMLFNDEGKGLGKRIFPASHEEICARPWSGFPIAHPAFMGKYEWFSHFKYRENLFRAQDQDLLARSFEDSRFINLPDILLGYRECDQRVVKRLSARRYLAKSLVSVYAARGKVEYAVAGMVVQLLKSVVDIVVSTLPQADGKMMRGVQIPSAEEDKLWASVWKIAHDADGSGSD